MKKPYTLLNKAEPYVWILPSIILMFIFIIIPIGFVFRMAFSQVTKAGLVKGFIGFKNFEKVLGGAKFGMVLKNTVIWTLYVVILSTILGFILALLLNNEFKGRKIARAIVVFPWATTLVIQASVWKFIINIDYGSLNTLLKTLGVIEANINWTPTPRLYSPGKSPVVFSLPFPSSASLPCPVCSPLTLPTMKQLWWTAPTTGSSCSTSPFLWSSPA